MDYANANNFSPIQQKKGIANQGFTAFSRIIA